MQLTLMFTLTVFMNIRGSHSENAPLLKKNFEPEKYIKPRWWLNYRSNLLKNFDRCVAISFGLFFNNDKIYKRTDHEISGSIDTSYQPVEFHDTGYHFKIEDGDEARVDVVETDYESYTIVWVTLKNHKEYDHLAILLNKPQPEAETKIKVEEELMKFVGVPLDSLEIVNNTDCPVNAKTLEQL